MDLANLLESTATVEATYKNNLFRMEVFTEKLTPAYRAKAILLTSRAQAEVEAGAEGESAEAKDEAALMVSDMVKSWRDGDDQPITVRGVEFAPVYENLVNLSYPLLSTLLKAITTFLGEQANPQNAQD